MSTRKERDRMVHVATPPGPDDYVIRVDDVFPLKRDSRDPVEDAWELLEDSVDCSQHSGSYPKHGPNMLVMLKDTRVFCEKNNLITRMFNGELEVKIVIYPDGLWGVLVKDALPEMIPRS